MKFTVLGFAVPSLEILWEKICLGITGRIFLKLKAVPTQQLPEHKMGKLLGDQ